MPYKTQPKLTICLFPYNTNSKSIDQRKPREIRATRKIETARCCVNRGIVVENPTFMLEKRKTEAIKECTETKSNIFPVSRFRCNFYLRLYVTRL